MDDGVVVPRVFVELSGCVSDKDNFLTIDTGLGIFDIDNVGTSGFWCNFKPE